MWFASQHNINGRTEHTFVVQQSTVSWQSGRSAIGAKPVTDLAFEAVQLVGSRCANSMLARSDNRFTLRGRIYDCSRFTPSCVDGARTSMLTHAEESI
jgi:hypothetical protein